MLEEIPKEVLPNEAGEFAPDFLRVLMEKMNHISNRESLSDTEHLKGNKPLYLVGDCEIDKKAERVCVRIDRWNEYGDTDKRPTVNFSILNLHDG